MTFDEDAQYLVTEMRRRADVLLTIVIVTWNCEALIGTCLDILSNSIADFGYEVIVVDNASSDGTLDVLHRRTDVDVIVASSANLGFGRGNNLGIRFARGEFALLLNPDAFLEDPSALGRLVNELAARPDVVAIGPMLLNRDGTHQVGDAGFAPSLAHVTSHQLMLSKINSGVRGYYVVHKRHLLGPAISVGWLGGACQLVRLSAFRQVGGFSDEIFMYGEDVELGASMGEVGRLLYVPTIKVVHLQGATQKKDGAVYVSTRWIDALFESGRMNVRGRYLRRLSLKIVLASGFLIRAFLYYVTAIARHDSKSQEKASGMMKYLRHVSRM